jgi:MafB19-like deaminase
MAKCDPVYTAHQLKRWMAPNAHLFISPDWRRHVQPGSELAAVYELYEQKYRPDQPRVPDGSPEGGQWTTDGGGTQGQKPTRVRLASSDKPSLGRGSRIALALEAAKRAFEAFRSANNLRDLFGHDIGTLAYTEIDGKGIYGTNSTLPAYDKTDRMEANAMREALIRDFPDTFDKENLGQMPNNAIYHAEANALMRAARENGGSLKGQELIVSVDKPMCPTCPTVLPYVGIELDNPTVTFVGPKGEYRTMRDGRWISGR